MKKNLLNLLFLLSPFWVISQVQVGNGTSTSAQTPINAFYGFSYSQSVYLQGEINASGSITGIQYYFNGSSLSNSDSLTVYLGHSSRTTYASTTDWEPIGNLTQVFKGSIPNPGGAGWVVITFDTPFAYNNTDNLIVAVEDDRPGFNGSSDDFYNFSSGSTRSIYYRNDATNPDPSTPPTASGTSTLVPNIIFDGITQSCPALTGLLTSNISDDSVTVSWTEGTNDISWEVEYGLSGFALDTGMTIIVNDTFANINGLIGNTEYDVYVRGICAVGDTGIWVGPITFTTNCSNFTPSYLEDFSSYVPDCWEEATGRLTSTTSLSLGSSDWTSDGFGNNGSSGAARVNISGTTKDEWLISPSIDLGNGSIQYQVEFDVALTASFSTNPDTLQVDDTLAFLISLDNGTTWSPANILSIWEDGSEPSNTGDHITIDLSAYTGVVKFAFYGASTVSGESTDASIDNFWVREIPSCLEPDSLALVDVAFDSITVEWNDRAVYTTLLVEYDTAGFALGTGNEFIALSNPVGINGLSGITSYDVYVRGVCSPGDTSLWVGPLTVTTPCGPYTPAYLEAFNSYLPECWEEALGELTDSSTINYTSSKWGSDGLGNVGTSGAARANVYGSDEDWLISPTIDLGDGSTPYRLELDVAFTDFGNTSPGSFDVDDTVALVISTDNGITWSDTNVLQIWDTLNEPSNTGDHIIIDLTSYTGLVKFGMYAKSQTTTGDNDFSFDNFWVREVPACDEPDSIHTVFVSRDSISVGWNGAAGNTSFIVEYDTAGFTLGTGIVSTPLATANFNIGGLDINSSYDFYVRGICSGTDTSIWVGPYTITTLESCPNIDSLAIAVNSFDSATVSWVAGFYDSSYIIEYDSTGFTLGTGNIVNTTNNPFGISGLTPNTTYQLYIRSICTVGDSSELLGPISFTTPCTPFTPDYFQDFATGVAPDCWSEAEGLIATNTVFTSSTSDWTADGFANSGTTGSAKIETYSGFGSVNGWLISPSIDLGTGATQYIVEFDIALTEWISTTGSTMDADDKLHLVISTNNGSTWSDTNILMTFDNTTPISNTGDYYYYDLSAYTGIVQFGLYFESPAGPSDNDLFIDNFNVVTRPACLPLQNLSASTVTDTSVELTWTNGPNDVSWSIEYGGEGFTQGSGTIVSAGSNPFTVTGLTADSTYDFYVQGICSASDSSTWVGPITVSTPCAVFTPNYFQNFSMGVAPECWDEAEGLIGTSTSFTSTTTSSWTEDGFGNVGSTGSASINTWSFIDQEDWLISPSIDLGNGSTEYIVEFDLAMTEYDDVTAATLDADDKLHLVISTDNGITWSDTNILMTFDNTSTISPTGDYQFFDLSTLPYTGLVRFAIYFETTGGSSDNDIFIDNFNVIVKPTCPKLTNLNVSNPTTTTLDLAWTNGPNDISWMVEYGPVGFTQGTGTTVAAATNPYTVTNLSPDVAYDFYVRSICGAGDSSFWVGPVFDTTIAVCAKTPNFSLLTADSNKINVGWNLDTIHTGYIIEFGPEGFTPGTGTTVSLTAPDNFYSATGLDPLTEYDFYIKSICTSGDTSANDGPYTFETGCGSFAPIPYTEDFISYVPECWEEATGRLTTSSTLNFGSSDWTNDGFANNGTTGAARMEIWTASKDEWLISPSFNLGSGSSSLIVEFDVALTVWNTTVGDTLQADDTLALVISTDNGQTWSTSNILNAWVDGNEPSASGDHVVYSLAGYTGGVRLGFYAASSVTGEDVNVYIDNFVVRDTNAVSSIDENINEISDNQFKVYPNPNNGEFNILNEGLSVNANISILDISGKVIKDFNRQFTTGDTQNINISNFESGIYILRVNKNGVVEQHKIIVQ